MGKLRHVRPRLGRLAPRLVRKTDAEGHRTTDEWRGWYKLKAWAELRVRVFRRDNYTCQWPGCGLVTRSPAADHRIPHRGDRALFFADGNVWTLCKPHHDGAKQRQERAYGRS